MTHSIRSLSVLPGGGTRGAVTMAVADDPDAAARPRSIAARGVLTPNVVAAPERAEPSDE